MSLLSHDRYQYDSLTLSKQTWAYPRQHLQQLLWCLVSVRLNLPEVEERKLCFWYTPTRRNHKELSLDLLRSVESVYFFYSNPVFLVKPILAYQAEKRCSNNSGINNCCVWMVFLILVNLLSLGNFCWLDTPACLIPKLICETTKFGTFEKTPWLRYQPIEIPVSTPPLQKKSVSSWTWTLVLSTEQSKTAHAVKFGDTARIKLRRVKTNRSYYDTELQFPWLESCTLTHIWEW